MPESEPKLGADDDASNPFDAPYDDRSPLTRLSEWALDSFRRGRGLPPPPPLVLMSVALVSATVLSAVGTAVLPFIVVTSYVGWPLALLNGSGVNTVALLMALWVLTFAARSAVLVRVIRVMTAWALISSLPLLAAGIYEPLTNDDSNMDAAFAWSAALGLVATVVVSIACLAATSRARQPEPSADRDLIPI